VTVAVRATHDTVAVLRCCSALLYCAAVLQCCTA
jgi:hypothetical protein